MIPQKKVLIFTKATDYIHESLPVAAQYFHLLCSEFGWEAIVSDDSSMLEEPSAPRFDIIIFVNNSGELFSVQKEALTKHIREGRGVLGVHAALASFLDGQDAEGGSKLAAKNSIIQAIFGTHFLNHPPPQEAEILIDHNVAKALGVDICEHLPDSFLHTDEFFNYSSNPLLGNDLQAIAYVNEKTYEGGLMGEKHPVVWCRYLGEKKAPIFYCALGHFSHSYHASKPGAVSKFLYAGLQFIGNALNDSSSMMTAA